MYLMRVIISFIINLTIDGRSGVFLGLFAFLVIMLLEEICFVKGEFSCYEIS